MPEPEKFVCSGCLTDSILAADVEAAAEDTACSYCGRSPAAPLEVVVSAVEDAISVNYQDPANEVPYESAEGGYQGAVYSGYELVTEMEAWTNDESIVDDVATALAGTVWSDRPFFSLGDYEQLDYGWQQFVQQIKHQTRFLFFPKAESDGAFEGESIPPEKMLSKLGDLFLEYELFTVLSSGTQLYRVRVVRLEEDPSTVDELGSPPVEVARSNRMSPVGISMFYAAPDVETAVLETYDPDKGAGKKLVIATFAAARELILLDLTKIPEPPSIFDTERRYLIPFLAFLRGFAEDLARPVARDRTEHVEYVPTQVVTEYVRHRLLSPAGEQPHGILYRSSRLGGKEAVVLFAEPDECGPRETNRFWTSEVLVNLIDRRVAMPAEFSHLPFVELVDD